VSDKDAMAQLVVIGAGPGGYAAAFLAADLGVNVTLIDSELNPGGVCLYRGCIPSKALLHVSKLINEAREAGNWGIKFSSPKIDLAILRSWKENVVTKLTSGLGQLTKQRKINYIQGTTKFLNSETLEIAKLNGEKSHLKFGDVIIATGSQPTIIPAFSIDSPRVWDSTQALALEDIPPKLLVVGGGYIGLEMGTVYAALGSKVTVVEMMAGLLPGSDRDLVKYLQNRLTSSFESIMVNTKVVNMKKEAKGIKVNFVDEKGNDSEQMFDKVLISIGRTPNSKNLGLENTRVELDKKGFIKVNEKRQTTDPRIYAIGDIAGEPMLAHKASHEGRIAAEVIAGHKVVYEPAAIPAVVFTDPEIAWCGLTENEAKEQGITVDIARFSWVASGRALTMGRTDGMTKMLFDPDSSRILGMGIVGVGAGELIAEGVLAIEMAALATDIKLSIHPHPTLSETVMESAEMFFGQSTHIYRPKRK
jgi:dihydrolipoamide dehydrogenase